MEQVEIRTYSLDHMCSFLSALQASLTGQLVCQGSVASIMPTRHPVAPPRPPTGAAWGPWVPEPYLHRCLCCHHRRFPWMCHSPLLSSPAGRHSATRWGPRYICHCHCTTQGNPLQGKARRIEVWLSAATCSHTHSHSSCLLGKCSHILQHIVAPGTRGRRIARNCPFAERATERQRRKDLLGPHG